jgi:uncharacterized protein (TIGR02117 family)
VIPIARWAAHWLTVAALAAAVSACAASHQDDIDAAAAVPAALPLRHDPSEIAVVERWRHTDIALPAEALTGPAASLKQAFPGLAFVVFGFGDRAYLMSREVTIGQTIAALFPGPGVILVTALRAAPGAAFGPANVVTLRLDCPQRTALLAFINDSLSHGEGGALQRLGDGPYPGSAFYATDLVYDLLYDCNRWTAEALAAAGLPVTARGVILASQVSAQVRPLAARIGPGAARNWAPASQEAPCG